MARRKKAVEGGQKGGKGPVRRGNLGPPPQSLGIAGKGISTSSNFRDFMSALMSDVIAGRVTAQVTNAACNAGGKMLRMVELEMQYGLKSGRQRPTLALAFDHTKALPAGK